MIGGRFFLSYIWGITRYFMRIAINGFGRIGKMTARQLLDTPGLELVAINDLADLDTQAHLFKYDSVHGKINREIGTNGHDLTVDGVAIRYLSTADPTSLPWKELGIDLVIESSGHLTAAADAGKHIEAGAQKVIISAPSKSPEIKTVVMGINDHLLDKDDVIVSNASCTTNCAAPLIKILDDLCGIESGYITTVHSYTGDQRLHDSPHKDLRRARAGAISIVPTTTGAAKAITRIFPHLDGKLGGCGIRVPVPDGSLTDISCVVKNVASIEAINEAFKAQSQGSMKGILEYTEDPLVSVDIVDNPNSCIYDALLTSVVGNMVKIVGWYDNEMGYSNRLIDLALKMRDLD